MSKRFYFSADVTDFLSLLFRHEVRYLIVGGEAVIYYGHARLTGDIDIFYERTRNNAINLFTALEEFWDNGVPGIRTREELLIKGTIFQFGVPPNRIDLMNVIENVEFKDAWAHRNDALARMKGKKILIHYIGLQQLIKNKKAVGRHRDKDDLLFLNAQAAKMRIRDKR
jgi:hypothetical protein